MSWCVRSAAPAARWCVSTAVRASSATCGPVCRGCARSSRPWRRKPVIEITGETTDAVPDGAQVFIGTEAVLHRVGRADAVVFLDFDQELLAPRYRAAEEALTLLIRAARLVGDRNGDGQIVVQTRLPQHETIQAALHGDPERLVAREAGAPEVAAVPAVRRGRRRIGSGRALVHHGSGPTVGRRRHGTDRRRMDVARRHARRAARRARLDASTQRPAADRCRPPTPLMGDFELIGGREARPVVIADYDPAWTDAVCERTRSHSACDRGDGLGDRAHRFDFGAGIGGQTHR